MAFAEFLPFIFVIAVVYGGLEVSDVFKNKAVKFIIALVVGYFAMTNASVVAFITQFLPLAAIVFVVVFLIGFIYKVFQKGGEKDWTLIGLIIATGLIGLAQFQGSLTPYLNNLPIDPNNFLAIVLIMAFIAFLYAAYKKGG